MISTIKIESPLGEIIAGATDEGICLLEYSDSGRAGSELEDLNRLLDETSLEYASNHLQKVRSELSQYFQGYRKEFSVPLRVPGSSFRKRVWEVLMGIPYGMTWSYTEQANALGSPYSVRAVAAANGCNRISIIIPCHRVIGSDGSLTGYGGGLERKRWLLEHEKKYSGKPLDLTLF